MTVHEDYGPYKLHPLANAFPLIKGGEFDQDRSASPRRRSAKRKDVDPQSPGMKLPQEDPVPRRSSEIQP